MSNEPAESIAIVGASCRFPGGADDLASYWELLVSGQDAITEVPDSRWDVARLYDPDPAAVGKMYTRRAGFVRDVEQFDAAFFGISAREAASMDPQQRLLLEVAWHALEDAGLVPSELRDASVGVFVGIGSNDYIEREVLAGDYERIHPFSGTGNFHGVAAGRLSFSLGLCGPSLSIDAACASSLVALHQAALSLRAGDCDLAIVGGVNVIASPASSIYLCKTGVLSPDGRCRSFDVNARGYVRGEGCGVVVLRRLGEAQARMDRIRAVLRGSAVNHNGQSVRLTAPKGQAQQQVIERALHAAGVEPTSVGYLEAHGTASILGDLIELRAASAAFRCAERAEPLRVGCVKTNIGHLEAAAGMASLLKVVAALEHGALPGMLHLEQPAPKLPNRGLHLLRECEPWPSGERPRVAGVSAFSLSGTNAHVVLAEAPRATAEPSEPCGARHVLVVSAKSEEALTGLVTRWSALLERCADEELGPLSRAAATTRSRFPLLIAAVGRSRAELLSGLRAYARGDDSQHLLRGDAVNDVLTGVGQRVAGWRSVPLYVFQRAPHWLASRALSVPAAPIETHDSLVGAVVRAADDVGQPSPHTPLQAELRELWREALGQRPAGVDESFLDLGGQSVSAVRILARIRERYGVDLPLQQMFEASSIRAVASRLEQLMVERGDRESARQAIRPRAEGAGPIPLTFQQRRLWLADQLLGPSSAFNLSVCVELGRRCDVAALRRSFLQLSQRHEVLRTCFRMQELEPVQVVAPESVAPVTITGELRARDRDAIRALLQEDVDTPFDLARGPLWRVRVLRLPEQDLIALTIHHIVADGWSQGVFLREWWRLYLAEEQGVAHGLAPLPIQYSDYASWQHSALTREALEPQLAYWLRYLQGATATELPVDHARPARPSGRAASERFQLGPAAYARIQELARARHASVAMVTLAAFQLLLQRYTGVSDLVVGLPVANRERPELEGLLGLFMNTLAIRTQLQQDDCFESLLDRVRADLLSAFSHAEVPFDRLIERLAPVRDISRHPLFQIAFVFQNTPSDTALTQLEEAPLRLHCEQVDTARLDLELQVWEDRGGLTGKLIYAAELFDAGTIADLAGTFVRLLERCIEAPTRLLRELELVSPEELHARLAERDAVTESASDVLAAFERAVKSTPDALAASHGDTRLSYRELELVASWYADQLAARGVGREERVAVFLDRSVDAIAALIGIWRLGAVYVPLDRSFPEERIAWMVRDADARLVVARGEPPVGCGLPVLDSLTRPAPSAIAVARTPRADVGSSAPAFLLYTSGSTGRPKGVLGTRGLVADRLAWEGVPFVPGEVVAFKTSLNFIDSIWEIFAPLLRCGSIAVVDQDVVRDPPRLLAMLRASQVTRVVLVPSLLRALIDCASAQASMQSSVRAWHVSGEPLEQGLVTAFHACFGRSSPLVNIYGATEIWDATWNVVDPDAPESTRSIGRPLPQVRALVVDADARLAPLGAIGELWVGGPSLAGGRYWNQPELSAERFVRDPFSLDREARLYRTGDLVRVRSDGTLDYLGRRDTQVKLRGYRIELAEIEAQLSRFPGVSRAAVVVQASPRGPSLVAFVVAASGAPPLASTELRCSLREQLPEPMVPAHFEWVDELPTTPTGKLDRRALQTRRVHGEMSDAYLAPRSVLERTIAEAWSAKLGVATVGIRQNFFDLGGHSLLLASLRDLLERRLERTIPMTTLFQHPTIELLAAALERDTATGNVGSARGLRRTASAHLAAQQRNLRRTTRK